MSVTASKFPTIWIVCRIRRAFFFLVSPSLPYIPVKSYVAHVGVICVCILVSIVF